VFRTTARGTAGSTVTPNIANDIMRGQAPTSGLFLDLAAYSVQPTLDGSVSLFNWPIANVAGSAVVLPFEITIPPTSGIVLRATLTAWPVSDVNFAWREEW
jgi:hypothetical protein